MANPTQAGSDLFVRDVYRLYVSLCAAAAASGWNDLAHRLVLCAPVSVGGPAPLIAASIASAGVLCIEPDAATIKQCTREGITDFTVNTLDEALRALKNEVRKGLSIAICLEGEPERWLTEMVERGVQPDVICRTQADDAGALDIFCARGAKVLEAAQPVDEGLNYASWRVSEMPGKWLSVIDEEVRRCLPGEDRLRQAWLKRAPRYMGRSMRTEHGIFLTRPEADTLVRELRARTAAESWKATVTVTYYGEASTLEQL